MWRGKLPSGGLRWTRARPVSKRFAQSTGSFEGPASMRRSPVPTSLGCASSSVKPRSSSSLAAVRAVVSRADSSRPGTKVMRQGVASTPQAGAPIHVANSSKAVSRRRPSRAADPESVLLLLSRRSRKSNKRQAWSGPERVPTEAASPEAATAAAATCAVAVKARFKARATTSCSARISRKSAVLMKMSSNNLARAFANRTTSREARVSRSISSFSKSQGRMFLSPKPYQASVIRVSSKTESSTRFVRQSRQMWSQPSMLGNEPSKSFEPPLSNLAKTSSVIRSTRSRICAARADCAVNSAVRVVSVSAFVAVVAGDDEPSSTIDVVSSEDALVLEATVVATVVVVSSASSDPSWRRRSRRSSFSHNLSTDSAAVRNFDQTRPLESARSTASESKTAPPKASVSSSSSLLEGGGHCKSPTVAAVSQWKLFRQDSVQEPSCKKAAAMIVWKELSNQSSRSSESVGGPSSPKTRRL
mmetsp:Transcript_28172/g.61191  ORF Transcript_28172/g.61191 Transcript_28172/m.61191 type:complete len:474 (-) Transcript_28172:87-1508(-)